MNFYECIFEVTYTCQNGNERRMRKSVYSKPFDKDNRFIPAGKRVEMSRELLEKDHYYDCKFIKLGQTKLYISEA